MYKKILVPLDGSKVAEAVLSQARMLAECSGAEITLLSVVVHPHYDFFINEPQLASSAHEVEMNEARHYLERIAVRLRESGLRVGMEIGEGRVAETILECAEAVQADLIAMSTHGRGGLGRWLIGSVAEKVIRGAKVPVLLVRPDTAGIDLFRL